MIDYDRAKKRMLLETFPSIEGIFTKTDAAGNSFGDRDYQYKVLKVEGLVHKQDFGDQKVFLSPETDTLFLVDDQTIYECKKSLHELDTNTSLQKIVVTDTSMFAKHALPSNLKDKSIEYISANGTKYIQGFYHGGPL
jgi:hypothetical protein